MRSIVISPDILRKLQIKHDVSRREIEQCFENREGKYLEDIREEHLTDPATLWFLSSTNCGRLLKIVFVLSDDNVYIKSAYEPGVAAIELYEKRAN